MSDETGYVPAPAPEPAPVTSGGGRGKSGPGWIAGLVLIALGVAFMLQNVLTLPARWWTVFIYIPALVSFYNSFRTWRKDGRFSPAASGSLTGALLLTTVATILALDLDWGQAWPAILIVIGIGLVLGSVLGRGKA